MNDFELNQNTNRLAAACTQSSPETGIREFLYTYSPDPAARGRLDLVPQLPLPDQPLLHFYTLLDGTGITGIWKPDAGMRKQLIGDWADFGELNLSHSAPVVCLFNGSDQNVITVSVSEASRDLHLSAGVHEENGQINLHIVIHFSEPVSSGQLKIRFDFRPLPFYKVLQDTAAWWDTILPDPPMEVPDCARFPMYSTWYSYHQEMNDELLLDEYRQAAKMGMKAVIIDDGWQTSDNNRGYGFCGDWQPAAEKFPDFARHVRHIHDLGMKCMIWYSVPFMGEYSAMWNSFKDMLLHYDPVLHTGILDPRYPQVRSYLISTYQQAARSWGLDGFKLDFIDSFRSYPDTPSYQEAMDFHEIQDAVYCLMLGIHRTLKEENPDLLIEFRQNYIGPQMRRFGNIFRVGDCPMSGITNRVAITDLKLLGGSTAVHSDMIMWPEKETAENAAVQLIDCIFSTLQISVRLAGLSERQRKTLEHYLRFSIEYRDVLLNGEFTAHNPLAQYPFLDARKNGIWIGAVYDGLRIVEFPEDSSLSEYWLLNGTTRNSLYASIPENIRGQLTVYDCCGENILCQPVPEICGVRKFAVPSGGSLKLTVE